MMAMTKKQKDKRKLDIKKAAMTRSTSKSRSNKRSQDPVESLLGLLGMLGGGGASCGEGEEGKCVGCGKKTKNKVLVVRNREQWRSIVANNMLLVAVQAGLTGSEIVMLMASIIYTAAHGHRNEVLAVVSELKEMVEKLSEAKQGPRTRTKRVISSDDDKKMVN